MSPRTRFPLSLLCVLVLLGLAPAGWARPAGGKKYAFLVACSGYRAGEFRKLTGTVTEMRDFRQALLDSGFDARDVVFLHDDAPRRYHPEKKKVLDELSLLLGRLKKEDTLVVALNGHGLHFKGEKVGFFVPLDGEAQNKESLVPMDGKGGLFAKLKECKAGRRLMLVNACRNDPLDDRAFAVNKVKIDDEDPAEVPEGIAALYSCKPGQKSYEYPKDSKKGKPGRSLFYHHLIEAWNGEYSGGKPITLEHVFREVRRRTTSDATELFEKAQMPQPRREYDDEWVVNARPLSEAEKLYRRGMDLSEGRGGLVDQKTALRCFRQAALGDHALACVELACCYYYGLGITQDAAQARRWAGRGLPGVRTAAAAGHADAQTQLAWMLSEGLGVKKDEKEAVRWYLQAAARDSLAAIYTLGVLYEDGRGVKKDDREAARWYLQAAEKGDPRAMNNLGMMYQGGRGVARDYKEAIRWYRLAADKDHYGGMSGLGTMYEKGLGVERDYEEAMRWYRKAADRGDDSAMINLATMYRLGRGVEKDDKEAIRWYRQSAERGNSGAMTWLAYMYSNGQGVAKDEKEAARWYRKAADRGNSGAMNHLGWRYENGRGVTKDLDEAIKWYRKAAALGHRAAAKRLKALGQ